MSVQKDRKRAEILCLVTALLSVLKGKLRQSESAANGRAPGKGARLAVYGEFTGFVTGALRGLVRGAYGAGALDKTAESPAGDRPAARCSIPSSRAAPPLCRHGGLRRPMTTLGSVSQPRGCVVFGLSPCSEPLARIEGCLIGVCRTGDSVVDRQACTATAPLLSVHFVSFPFSLFQPFSWAFSACIQIQLSVNQK